jgi:capsule polysaccharide export protein KpsE/RkpR
VDRAAAGTYRLHGAAGISTPSDGDLAYRPDMIDNIGAVEILILIALVVAVVVLIQRTVRSAVHREVDREQRRYPRPEAE